MNVRVQDFDKESTTVKDMIDGDIAVITDTRHRGQVVQFNNGFSYDHSLQGVGSVAGKRWGGAGPRSMPSFACRILRPGDILEIVE